MSSVLGRLRGISHKFSGCSWGTETVASRKVQTFLILIPLISVAILVWRLSVV